MIYRRRKELHLVEFWSSEVESSDVEEGININHQHFRFLYKNIIIRLENDIKKDEWNLN